MPAQGQKLGIRIDDPDASLESIVERAFASPTGKDLSFDDHIIAALEVSDLLPEQ